MPDRQSYLGEEHIYLRTYVQKKLLLLQLPTTGPISTCVLIGRVVGNCSNGDFAKDGDFAQEGNVAEEGSSIATVEMDQR